MKIAIGCDHAGADLKEALKTVVAGLGYKCMDFGTNGPSSVDYPDFAGAVSSSVASGEYDRGILICGTGIGMSIAANKFPGVRASLCYDLFTARMSRMHNDANILVLGSRVTGMELAVAITGVWLQTDFEGGRHALRLQKIMDIEGLLCNGNAKKS